MYNILSFCGDAQSLATAVARTNQPSLLGPDRCPGRGPAERPLSGPGAGRTVAVPLSDPIGVGDTDSLYEK